MIVLGLRIITSPTTIVSTDILNFPLVPTDQKTLRSQLSEEDSVCCLELDPKSRDALVHVQHVLLLALQSYWLPCYLRHVMATQELPILEVSAGGAVKGYSRQFQRGA